ncbi:MAG: hypothetical protein H0S85_10380 [Desulfovibrionaceae bacterium]|jgi:hypothetical protein|nr:hypothetical protein [Desulfovibrionaceae bacterium]
MLDYYRFKDAYDLMLQGRIDEAKKLLTDLQTKYIEVCEENTILKTQIQEFEDILYLAKNLVYDGSHYWLMTGSIKQGPFCRNCYDKTGQLIRLNEAAKGWKCYTCGTRYGDRESARFSLDIDAENVKRPTAKVIPLYK